MVTERDDDILTGPVPDPDDEATPVERAHAKTFAELVDKTLAGRTPPAMSADDRALLEVATVIRAASGQAALAVAKRDALVESALRQAIGDRATTREAVAPTAPTAPTAPIAKLRPGRAPWIVAAGSLAVAAAAIGLWLAAGRVGARAPAALPDHWRSRAADPLIGPIPRDQAGDASARLDTIFADRLDGYRELRMRGGHQP